MNAKDRLVQDLERDGAPAEMIELAKRGFYDDYETWIETPITQLVHDCEAIGLKDIAEKARNGHYDAGQREARQWFDQNRGVKQ